MRTFGKFKSSFLLVFGFLGVVSCGSIEEPYFQENAQSDLTRGEVTVWKSLTSKQVIALADKAVGKSANKLVKRTIEPFLLNDRTLSEKLISDTVAFIVNYGDKDGFAVIANDNRIQEPLAYSETGCISNNPSLVKYVFLDKIENYLAAYEKSQGEDGRISGSNAPTRRFVIEPQIDIELGHGIRSISKSLRNIQRHLQV